MADITAFVRSFFSLVSGIVDLLKGVSFSFFGFSVSLWILIVSSMVIVFFVSIFWRGAKA